MKKIAICGAAGRMGLRLVDLIHADPQLKIVAAIECAGHPKIGQDAGTNAGIGEIGVIVSSETPQGDSKPDALIDFSQPAGAQFAIDYCLSENIPLVMATTGLEPETIEKIHTAAKTIPIVWAPSMSLAVNLSMKLVEMAGTALKDLATGVDVEIIERHHRYKADAPSGTALKFGEIIAGAMGQTQHQHGREGIIGKRPQTEIGYHAVRVGDNPGEHTIVFGMLGETIELKVGASNRDCYAAGAIAAAKFVTDQSVGLYNMFDVLGL